MKLAALVLILFASTMSLAQAPAGAQKPLSDTQLMQLVAAGMDNERLAKTVEERGLSFEPTGEYLAALHQKGALPVLLRAVGEVELKRGQYPLDQTLLRELVAAGTDSPGLAKAVMDRGVDFQPTAEFLGSLQAAGAMEVLLKALREVQPRPLGKDQVLGLLAGGVASERVKLLVQLRGLNFKPGDEYLETLRIAGADEALIRAVQQAKRPPEFVLAQRWEGHQRAVRSVAFSPDGRYVASGSLDATIKLWELTGPHEARTFTGHDDMVTAVAFSPDGRLLASAGIDRTVRIWEAATGRAPRTLTGHTGEIYFVSFGPEGRYLASGEDGTIRFWDIETGQTVRTLQGEFGNVVTLSPDGKLLAGECHDNSIRLWEAEGGRKTLALKGHTEKVNSLAFSPNGRYLASGSSDHSIKLWDPGTGREVRTLTGHDSSVWCVAFTPDGKYLASGSSDGTIRIWEADTGIEVFRLPEVRSGSVSTLAFSSDGRHFAAGNDDTILLWKLED